MPEKGVRAIRYVYKPYHPWRHGYRREKRKKWLLLAAKILLVLECLWLSYGYIRDHTSEKTLLWEKTDDTGLGEEMYGVGFGPESGALFWFHSYIEGADGQENAKP